MKIHPPNNKIQLPHTAKNLAALQLSRAESQLLQFWSKFSEISDLGSINNQRPLELHSAMIFRVAKTPKPHKAQNHFLGNV